MRSTNGLGALGGWWGGGVGAMGRVAGPGVRGAVGVADARQAGEATTLSGLSAVPYAERSVRVPGAGIGIRFRAPTAAPLAAVHTYWRRLDGACTLTLFADDGGEPGAPLASGPVAGSAGWVATPLDAALAGGSVYHVVLDCRAAPAARLGYVLDAERGAVAGGVWQLEDMRAGASRPRRAPASPLFALAFADGSWWGQPYRAAIDRPLARICGGNQVRQTIVPRSNVTVAGVQIPGVRGRRAHPSFTIETSEGTVVMAGTLGRTRGEHGRTGAAVAAVSAPVSLAAGTAYTVHLTAARESVRCLRQRTLATDLALGVAVNGVDTTSLRFTDDGGQTWVDQPAAALDLVLLGGDPPASPPATCGDGVLEPNEECDGRADGPCPGRCTDVCTCTMPPPACGDGSVGGSEQCDGAADTFCPGRCSAACTCTPAPPTCGDGQLAPGEECDGAADAACPGHCTAQCACVVPRRTYRSIYASGYFAAYDSRTTSVWPQRLGVILGEADSQGPLVANAKAAAAAAGNTDARFVFYFSLTSLDSKCGCFDARFYDSFAAGHPEWFLRDASGNRLSTFIGDIGTQRQFAVDVGNPAFVDAWIDFATSRMTAYGWDGVWADNVIRGAFDGWSGTPINPRTGARYTAAQYRQDELAALQRIRSRFDAAGKIVIGNHGSGYDPSTFADPVIQQQVTTMHGVEIEDCVYTFGGTPHSEASWIAQLTYLDFANRHGVLTQCRGGNGTIGDPGKRDYILASYLLTKEGLSNVAQLNTLGDWWDGLAVDLGTPLGGFSCLDPSAGLTPTSSCPSSGKIYAREWEKGRVLVNPTAERTVTVALGGTFLRNGSSVGSVTLGPRSGAVLVRP